MTKNNLLPDEIEVYHDKFGDLLAFKDFDLRVPGTRYVRADLVSTPNKPAEVDLDGLKRMSVKWYRGKFDSSDIIGMPSDREVIFGLLDYLHASGHLATGKAGGEPYRLSIEEQGVMRNALRKSVTVIEQQQPAAPTQIDAGELEKAIADLQSRLNISSEITINEGMPLKVNGLSQLSAQRLLQAARAQLAKSKGGV